MKPSKSITASKAVVTALALSLLGTGPALSQGQSYKSWSGYPQHSAEKKYQTWSGYTRQSDKDVARLIAGIRSLVNEAAKSRAADPVFLSDLAALLDQYSPRGGKGYVFLSDNFRDGNYTSNPTWKASAGQWRVDTNGGNTGLFSQVGQNQYNTQSQQVDALLNALLGLQTQQATRQDIARIGAVVGFTNAFVIKIRLTSQDSYGGLSIVPYQGSASQNSYRLIYRPNSPKGLRVQRITGGQVTEVGAYNGTVRLEDGRVHELVWSRDESGQMLVTVDGMNAIRATSAGINGNMDGLLLDNVGGSYWIHEVKIEGN